MICKLFDFEDILNSSKDFKSALKCKNQNNYSPLKRIESDLLFQADKAYEINASDCGSIISLPSNHDKVSINTQTLITRNRKYEKFEVKIKSGEIGLKRIKRLINIEVKQ